MKRGTGCSSRRATRTCETTRISAVVDAAVWSATIGERGVCILPARRFAGEFAGTANPEGVVRRPRDTRTAQQRCEEDVLPYLDQLYAARDAYDGAIRRRSGSGPGERSPRRTPLFTNSGGYKTKAWPFRILTKH